MEKRKFGFEIYQLGKDADRYKRFESLPEGVDAVDLKGDKYEKVYEAAIIVQGHYLLLFPDTTMFFKDVITKVKTQKYVDSSNSFYF